MTWEKWLTQAKNRLLNLSCSPKADSRILLSQVTGVSRERLLIFGETPLDDVTRHQLEMLLKRRERGEPIAYLIGKCEFWSLPLKVSSTTFIPRPDTECLVEKALSLTSETELSVLDLGTGSGAIALALAFEKPKWKIIGIDLKPESIELARENAVNLKLENVRFICGNWFEPLKGTQYNLIVSNPPYISINDPHLNQGDVRFEPKSSLIANDDGLKDLATICYEASTYLFHGGWIILEHGWKQGVEVQMLLTRVGFRNVNTVRDYGNNERISLGQWLL